MKKIENRNTKKKDRRRESWVEAQHRNEAQHKKGKLTARERIALLMDPGFV